jgi:hypothetical protein
MASLPESIEAVRFFWYGRRNSREEPLQDIVDCELPVIGDHAIARRNPAVQGALDGRLVLDVQLKPSSGILTAIGLAMFIVFVSTYIYQRIPELTAQDSARNAVLAVAGLFSALPAALAGGIAYRGQALATRMSRGPRTLVAGLAALSALLAATVSLRNVGVLTQWLAYATSICAFFVVGVLLYIQVGPRWRQNEHSRRPRRTAAASPGECYQHQRRNAIVFLIVWPLLTLAFARCQFALQHTHFFAPGFPSNVWRAFWSWFATIP